MAGDSSGDTLLPILALPYRNGLTFPFLTPLQPSSQPCPPEDEAPKHITGCEARKL